MNRLEKELMNRGIIYTCENESGYDPYEAEAHLVTITNDYIITCYYCNVIEPQLNIYDRHFNLIAQQSTEKNSDFFGQKARNPWSVAVALEETQEKQFIAWYLYDGEEDFTIITAVDEDEARRRFYANHDNLTEIHEIEDSEAYLAHI